MSFLDDLGQGLLGAGSGFLTGGLPGAVGGGVASGLLGRGKPLTLGNAVQTGLTGAGAGALSKSLATGAQAGFGKLKTALAQREAGKLLQPQIGLGVIPGEQGQGIFSRIGGALQKGGKGLLDSLRKGQGALQGLQGLLGGRGGPTAPISGGGAPGSGSGAPAGPPAPGQQGGGGATSGGGALDALQLLAGAGLLGAGAAQGGTRADIEGLFSGGPQQTQGMIAEAIAAEKARREAAEQQFLTGRESGLSRLEQILGQGTDEALRQSIQGRQESLNRQGLLAGPSGALDAALAQEAGNIRRQQLPALLEFERGTQGGLESLRGAGLEGELGLGRAGIERTFGQQDQLVNARLIERLRAAEADRARRDALLKAGGRLATGGLGLGSDAGRTLEEILRVS